MKISLLKKEGHGKVNLLGAIQKSCDCYFYDLAKSIDIDELSLFSKNFRWNCQVSIFQMNLVESCQIKNGLNRKIGGSGEKH